MRDIQKSKVFSINTIGDSISLLFTRRFGTFWFASFLSNIGTWAQEVAQPWLLLSLGASSFLLGLDTFAMGFPVILLTLVGGVLADRSDRRRDCVIPVNPDALPLSNSVASAGRDGTTMDGYYTFTLLSNYKSNKFNWLEV